MADLVYQDGEPMCGAGSSEFEDSLNRGFLAGGMRATDGKNNWATYKKRTSDPNTGANEIALYCKSDGSNLKFYWRDESNGAIAAV